MKRTVLCSLLIAMTLNVMAQKKITQTAGRTQLGEFAPEFAHLNDDILFGEVCEMARWQIAQLHQREKPQSMA